MKYTKCLFETHKMRLFEIQKMLILNVLNDYLEQTNGLFEIDKMPFWNALMII